MSHIYCPECGFQNPEAANYCAKCGALLVREEGNETTQSFSPEEAGELLDTLDDFGVHGPALVVRSGGGRSGETFTPEGDTTIGRSPECGVFLDDVTVSRRHAVLQRRDDGRWEIEDQGSLNGTFVNKRRVDSATLEDGDEIQIGKYRLTFLQR